MAGVPGALSDKPTELPARYERNFPWELDRRCRTAREIAADLWALWTDLGGIGNLSTQKQWLCERVVFQRTKMLKFESIVLANDSREEGEPERKLPFTWGEYSNISNVCQGNLKTLGLERQAKKVEDVHGYMARQTGNAA